MKKAISNIRAFFREAFTLRALLTLLVVMVFFIGLIFLFDLVLMPLYTKHGEALAVPNVIAKRYEAAKEELESVGLEVVKQGEKHSPQLPFGYVTEQNPRADRLVKKGRRIYLTISVGEREMELPNLVGMSETNAEETIKSLGLRIGDREYRYDPTEPPQAVVDQSHAAGSFVKISSAIGITVSLGRPVQNVTVPSLFANDLRKARREIQKSGLTLGRIRYRRNENLLPNTVIGQSVEAGTVVSPGDTLDLVVSTIPGNQ